MASHDIVSEIVRDPRNPPETVLLMGFLGESSEAGHHRLYLDWRLSTFLEIPEDSILLTRDLPAQVAPLGGHLVWVHQEAELASGRAGAHHLKTRVTARQLAQGPALPQASTMPPPCLMPPQMPAYGANPYTTQQAYGYPPPCMPAAPRETPGGPPSGAGGMPLDPCVVPK